MKINSPPSFKIAKQVNEQAKKIDELTFAVAASEAMSADTSVFG